MAASKTGTPEDAINNRIEALQNLIQPKRDEITEIREAAEKDIREIEDEIKSSTDEIENLELALSALRGEVPKPRKAPYGKAKRSSNGGGARIDKDEKKAWLVDFLKNNPEGITASGFAEEVGISKPSATNLVKDLIEEGAIGTNGKGQSQRKLLSLEEAEKVAKEAEAVPA